MEAAEILSHDVGKKAACEGLKLSRATFYRYIGTKDNQPASRQARPVHPASLSLEERQRVVDILLSERFQDKAPPQVYATLLDEGQYYCSIRTMYRILTDEYGEVKERRRQVRRPMYKKEKGDGSIVKHSS